MEDGTCHVRILREKHLCGSVLDLSQKLRNYLVNEYEKIKPQESKVSVQHQECSGEEHF